MEASAPGCHVALPSSDWVISSSPFSLEDLGLESGDEEEVPDLSVDPETSILSVNNLHRTLPLSAFISIGKVRAYDRWGKALEQGEHEDDDGVHKRITTIVAVVPPRVVLDLCTLRITPEQACGESPFDLSSDVQLVQPHPEPSTWVPERSYLFPLGGDGPYLCSQAEGGKFTHFYAGTWHAVDFECPVGTPVLAVRGGRVAEVRDHHAGGGIHCGSLFRWNSILVAQDDGLFAEYVHIAKGSAVVSAGDTVETGATLAKSGAVGFCPCPHLHLQLHESDKPDAPTVRFALLTADGSSYFPEAGQFYSPEGPVQGSI